MTLALQTLVTQTMLFELLQASGIRVRAATSRCAGPGGLRIVSIYPYRAHTAARPVGDGPRGRCYGPVNQCHITCHIRCDMLRVGKGYRVNAHRTTFSTHTLMLR